ncbi:sirohydrochlorin chelatase [Cohnella sp. REN36]|uniref:sirohydrochlorin chelatase n=1 Tax=Cohnella sp. REN36 TaxID=2887347 RepID=UPI001D1414C5|nr:CbiX/SirB N-terminal domain-containing protein [Cohnella sp. REN36]MCC3372161.1 cobalamin biosynthesis protein CbiX [Cohnella sp. REN36]
MKPGVLVISHGSREPAWVSRVDGIVDAARARLNDPVQLASLGLAEPIPVVACYLELVEGRLIQDGVHALEALGVTDIAAVPLFVSSGSTHVDEIGWALGAYETPRRETDLAPVAVRAQLRYGQPIGGDPEIADVLADKLAGLKGLDVPGELGEGTSDDKEMDVLLLIGHGSDEPWFHEAWRTELGSLAAELAARCGYADAETAMLRPDEVASRVALLRARRPGARVIALPVFLSEGYFTSEAIPRRLAGLDCVYAEGALLPHPRVGDWLVRRAIAGLTDIQEDGRRS